MNIEERLLGVAHGVAMGRLGHDMTYRLGAAAYRNDDVLVVAFNGAQSYPTWQHHAEARLCRKLTPCPVVAVVRVLSNGHWAMARPCDSCQTCMRRRGVQKVVYSIQPGEYGALWL